MCEIERQEEEVAPEDEQDEMVVNIDMIEDLQSIISTMDAQISALESELTLKEEDVRAMQEQLAADTQRFA